MNEQIDYGFLNTQEDPRFGARRYGKLGTVAKNGCGLIALYNVERAADETTQFEPFYAERKKIKTNLFGLLGTRPSTIAKNLRKERFSVERISRKKAPEAVNYDSVIVLYWQLFSAHYVAGIRRENGTYTLYNEFTKPYAMNLRDYLDYLKRHKKHVVRVWGIRFPEKTEQ